MRGWWLAGVSKWLVEKAMASGGECVIQGMKAGMRWDKKKEEVTISISKHMSWQRQQRNDNNMIQIDDRNRTQTKSKRGAEVRAVLRGQGRQFRRNFAEISKNLVIFPTLKFL